jgi:hypothetical protein
MLLNQSPIIWSSNLQSTIALSSTEAEYNALTSTAREVIWLRNLMYEIGHEQTEATVIYEDNNSAMKIAESDRIHSGVKHAALKVHFIRERVMTIKDIRLVRKDTTEMTADLFTKQLPFTLFDKHRQGLMVKRCDYR